MWLSGGQQSVSERDQTDSSSVQGLLTSSFILSDSVSSSPSLPFLPYLVFHPSWLQIYSSSWLWLACPPTNLYPAFLSSLGQECYDMREVLYHHDGKCQVHKINANFMALLSHSAKFYETEKTWKLMLQGHLVGRKGSRLFPTLSVGSSSTRFTARDGDCFGYWGCYSASWGPLKWRKNDGVDPGRECSTQALPVTAFWSYFGLRNLALVSLVSFTDNVTTQIPSAT